MCDTDAVTFNAVQYSSGQRFIYCHGNMLVYAVCVRKLNFIWKVKVNLKISLRRPDKNWKLYILHNNAVCYLYCLQRRNTGKFVCTHLAPCPL